MSAKQTASDLYTQRREDIARLIVNGGAKVWRGCGGGIL